MLTSGISSHPLPPPFPPANVFGKVKTDTSFIPVSGAGFSLSVPAKWNPSREFSEYPGVVLRYEDGFDASSNLVVIKQATSSSDITDYGSPGEFLRKVSQGREAGKRGDGVERGWVCGVGGRGMNKTRVRTPQHECHRL